MSKFQCFPRHHREKNSLAHSPDESFALQKFAFYFESDILPPEPPPNLPFKILIHYFSFRYCKVFTRLYIRMYTTSMTRTTRHDCHDYARRKRPCTMSQSRRTPTHPNDVPPISDFSESSKASRRLPRAVLCSITTRAAFTSSR